MMWSIRVERDLPLSLLQNSDQLKGTIVFQQVVFFDADPDNFETIEAVEAFLYSADGEFDLSKNILEDKIKEASPEELDEDTKEYLKTIMDTMEDGIVYVFDIESKFKY